MRKIIILISISFALGLLYFKNPIWAIGLPTEHPIYCTCIGYKNMYEDPNGIPRCQCYGAITDGWLE